jgi:predicted solute-binding protein
MVSLILSTGTWVGRSSSRGDAAKYKDLQHFISIYREMNVTTVCHYRDATTISSTIYIKVRDQYRLTTGDIAIV